jgi:hypothetical protein
MTAKAADVVIIDNPRYTGRQVWKAQGLPIGHHSEIALARNFAISGAR